MTASFLLAQALLTPASVEDLSPRHWDLLVRQARRANLLGRLHAVLHAQGRLDAVPTAPRQHLLAAATIAQRQTTAVHWEIECIAAALAASGVRLVLLKGAAYTAAGTGITHGRLYSDVDILVPKSSIDAVEGALLLQGWQASHHDAYDQRYYRAWMHEIPPMQHIRRGSTIDVHHDILPQAFKRRVAGAAMLEAAIATRDLPGVYVLQPIDMVLHSAVHLFHEGEFANGLRDLFDLDGLLREFASEASFWQDMIDRAVELGLGRSLYYALHVCRDMLGTPVPAPALAAIRRAGPPAWVAGAMIAAFRLALRPVHGSVTTRAVQLARSALYLRAHSLRLPWPLLAYHLGRKCVLRLAAPSAPATP